MASYIKQLKDSDKVDSFYPISLAQAIYLSDLSTNLETKLSSVDSNISDLSDSIALKANIASPAFTGVPTAPTASAETNTTQIATTAFVQEALSEVGGGGTTVFVQSETPSGAKTGDLWYKIL